MLSRSHDDSLTSVLLGLRRRWVYTAECGPLAFQSFTEHELSKATIIPLTRELCFHVSFDGLYLASMRFGLRLDHLIVSLIVNSVVFFIVVMTFT